MAVTGPLNTPGSLLVQCCSRALQGHGPPRVLPVSGSCAGTQGYLGPELASPPLTTSWARWLGLSSAPRGLCPDGDDNLFQAGQTQVLP